MREEVVMTGSTSESTSTELVAIDETRLVGYPANTVFVRQIKKDEFPDIDLPDNPYGVFDGDGRIVDDQNDEGQRIFLIFPGSNKTFFAAKCRELYPVWMH